MVPAPTFPPAAESVRIQPVATAESIRIDALERKLESLVEVQKRDTLSLRNDIHAASAGMESKQAGMESKLDLLIAMACKPPVRTEPEIVPPRLREELKPPEFSSGSLEKEFF